MNDRVEHLGGRLIISCQALPREPLHSFFIMDRMILAAKEGGTAGIWTNTEEDIAEIQKQVDLPMIGVIKRDYKDSKVYITPTMKEIEGLMEVKPEIIALDATSDLGPRAKSPDEFYREIRATYPGQLLMADCSTVEEALYTDQLGFNLIGTTLVRYIERSQGLKIESDDFPIIHKVVAKVKHRVTAEGNINAPEKARQVIGLGISGVVVGSIITKPQLVTRSFAQAIEAEG